MRYRQNDMVRHPVKPGFRDGDRPVVGPGYARDDHSKPEPQSTSDNTKLVAPGPCRDITKESAFHAMAEYPPPGFPAGEIFCGLAEPVRRAEGDDSSGPLIGEAVEEMPYHQPTQAMADKMQFFAIDSLNKFLQGVGIIRWT